jgi:hypothetical protein
VQLNRIQERTASGDNRLDAEFSASGGDEVLDGEMDSE